MRDKRRARRDRRDHLTYARHCMEVWAAWFVSTDERGWPRESSEVRALQSKQAMTDRTGDARWRGDGDPPPMPKETRASGGSRIPNIDRARLGPQMNRHLLDLVELGGERDAWAVRCCYLEADPREAAEAIGVSLRDYYRHRDRALAWLSGRLSRA